MKHLCIYLLATYIGVLGHVSAQHLFIIKQGNLYGYINEKGECVINPKYKTATDFSDGLASVRTNGSYGYIDEKGTFVIPEKYDFAIPFKNDLGIVYLNGKAFYIDKTGNKVFDKEFSEISAFQDGIALINDEDDKLGIINQDGQWLIKGLHHVGPFYDGLSIVSEQKGDYKSRKVGVIDKKGNYIIPLGKYEEIKDERNGYFFADIEDTNYIIDKTGKEIYKREHKNNQWLDGSFYCGLAIIHLYDQAAVHEKSVSYSTEFSYEGFINTKGEIILDDPSIKYVDNFHDNRAFVQYKDWHKGITIINTKGEKITDMRLEMPMREKRFVNGMAFVTVDDLFGLIDTNANFIIKPTFSSIHDIGIVDGYFFYSNSDEDDRLNIYGIAKTDGSIIMKPRITYFDQQGFKHGLLKCVIDNKLAYVNTNGKIVWQEKKVLSSVTNLNIDYMNRGYFYASSKADKSDLGGFGSSSNIAQFASLESKFPSNSLSVTITADSDEKFQKIYNGKVVYIANTTNNQVLFNAQDSRLHMKAQALDKDSIWKDIEYLPSSWCGNSYHTLSLEPNKFWKFTMPVYEGEFKTKLRIALEYIDPTSTGEKSWDRKAITIFSNEFDGSINPAQFWRKPGYSPNGIMDPYND